MNTLDAINGRYTYRGAFLPDELPMEDIEKILTAGLAGPVGKGVQTTSFVAVIDKEIREELSTVVSKNSKGVAPFILVLLSEDKYNGGVNFEIENYSAATENILLAVTALGYATVWTDGIIRYPENNSKVREILNVPANKTIRAVLPIGKPANPGPVHSKVSIGEAVTFNKF